MRFVFIFIVAFLLQFFQAISQNNFAVYDSTGKAHLYVNDDKVKYIYQDTLTTIFSVSGKRIYTNDTSGKPLQLFETSGKIFSAVTGYVYSKSLQILISFNKGQLFWGNTTNNNDYLIGYFEQNEEKQTAFINPIDGKPFFHIDTINVNTTTLVAVALYFIQYYHLENQTINIYEAENLSLTADSINIVRITNNEVLEYFYWDGQQLHNFSTGNSFNNWTFDGNTLYRTYYDTGDDWQWQNNELKRRWIFSESYFKQGNSYMVNSISASINRQMIIQDNMVRPLWQNSQLPHIIEFKGNIPDAVLIALAFGLIQ